MLHLYTHTHTHIWELFVLHQGRRKLSLRSNMSRVLMWIRLAWGMQTGRRSHGCCWKESLRLNRGYDSISNMKYVNSNNICEEKGGKCYPAQNKDSNRGPAQLMAARLHPRSWLPETEMIYIHFSSVWDTLEMLIKWPPCPQYICQMPWPWAACIKSGCDMTATFHRRALESHRCGLCPPLCMALFTLWAQSPSFVIWRKRSPSLAITVEHIFSWSRGSRGFQ